MARLHRSDDFQRLELGDLRGSCDLRVFDSQAEVVATVGRSHVRLARGLLGAGKGIERHLYALVANCVKTNLEAGQYALRGHLI